MVKCIESLIVLVLVTTIVFSAEQAAGTITWNWSDGDTGNEAGTFTTDGNLVGNTAPAGQYMVSDFSLDQTTTTVATGSVSGGQFEINQPPVGFLWDGSYPTQFFRLDGFYTNGFQFNIEPDPGDGVTDRIVFSIDFFRIDDAHDEIPAEVEQTTTINLTPVPEPSSLVCGGVLFVLAGLGIWSRRVYARG